LHCTCARSWARRPRSKQARPGCARKDDGQSTWRFVGTDGEPANLSHSPRLSTDDLSTLRHAALQGIGAVLVPHLLVANDLEGGALIRLLPSLKAHVGVVHAVFPSRRGMVPAVRTLLDFFSETVRLLPS
jgi:DNA-binding transcriptional LysR family regulator